MGIQKIKLKQKPRKEIRDRYINERKLIIDENDKNGWGCKIS